MLESAYAVLVVMLGAYVVLDGWDIGAGVIHFAVGRSEGRRAVVIRALGPLWVWHEVWLVGTGGVLFAAFPSVLSSALSGFYLAVFLLLWGLVVRGLALEVRSHLRDALWREAWDFAFAGSSLLLAGLVGTVLGNLIRGVPLDASGRFTLPFFTDFGVRGKVGILDWYSLSTAAFTILLLAAHGATYLTLKTSGPVHDRSLALGRRLWLAVPAALLAVTVETAVVRPGFLGAMVRSGAGWIGLGAVGAGAGLVLAGLRGRPESAAFLGSCLVLAGLLGAGAVGAYPIMLRSTLDPALSLTVSAGATDARGLNLLLTWWPFACAASLAYFAFVYRNYRGKVGEEP